MLEINTLNKPKTQKQLNSIKTYSLECYATMKRLDSGENIELEKIVTSELYFLDLALKNNGGFITQLFYIALILDEIVSSDSTCDIVSVSDIIAMLVTHELTIVNDKNKTVVKHLEAFANAWMVAEEKLKNVVKNRVE